MKLNQDIILKRLNEYVDARDIGQRGSDKLLLQRPEFYLDKAGLFVENHVYVCSADHLPALPTIEANVLLICLGNSPQLSTYKHRCSVININGNENIFTVFNIVQQIFNLYETWEASLNRILRNSASLQEILDTSKGIFENPMLLLGADFKYLARTEEQYLAEKMNINLHAETFDSEKLATFLSLHDMSTHVREPFVLSLMNRRSMAMNVFDNEEYMGCFIVFEEYRDFCSSDTVLCSFLYKYIRQAILSNPVLASERSALRHAIRDVVAGNPVDFDHRRVLDFANNKCDYVCACLQPEMLSTHLPSGYIPSIIEDVVPGSLSFELGVSVVALMPLESDEIQYDQTIAALNYKVGISQPFRNLFESNHYYYQAAAALKNGLLFEKEKTAYYFNDCITTELLLNAANGKPADIFFSEGLSALVEYDKGSQVSYLETLKVYLDNNMAVTKTAQDLFVHRSTLLERIGHINDFLAEELADPERRLAIRTAIGIAELYKKLEE